MNSSLLIFLCFYQDNTIVAYLLRMMLYSVSIGMSKEKKYVLTF